MAQNRKVKNTVIPSCTNMPSNSARRESRTTKTLAPAASSVTSETSAARLLSGP